MTIRLYYTDQFVLPLPPTHRFPMLKYALLRERIEQAPWRSDVELLVPRAATDTELLRAHTAEYLSRITTGDVPREHIKRIGFPWSPQLVERSRRSSGATIEACESALATGFGANLAGGTHHAFADRGEGFCLFNDSIVAARALQAAGLVKQVTVVDCDVHQGNGTAAIAADDPTIYTFSMHCARNYPFEKMRSDRDIELPEGTTDAEYLDILRPTLANVLEVSRPDLIIYVSGADPFAGDRMGRLALSKAGLAQRDLLIYEAARARGVPIAVSMAGGYAPQLDDIVDIHYQTIESGVELFGGISRQSAAIGSGAPFPQGVSGPRI